MTIRNSSHHKRNAITKDNIQVQINSTHQVKYLKLVKMIQTVFKLLVLNLPKINKNPIRIKIVNQKIKIANQRVKKDKIRNVSKVKSRLNHSRPVRRSEGQLVKKVQT